MAESGFQKAFESPGVFWLPKEPDRTIHGQLSHSADNGPQVSLVGGFGSALFRNFPVVHGILDNAPCTLFNCRTIRSKGSYGGLQQVILDARLLLVGDHIASLDEPAFIGSLVRFGGLDEWVNFPAIKIGEWQGDPANKPSRFDLATQPPIKSKTEIVGGVVTLSGEYSGSFGHREINWKHHSFFELSLDKPVSMLALHQSVFELQNLFALLAWTRAPVSYLSALRPVAKEAMNPSGKRWSGLYGHWTITPPEDKSSSHFLTYLADVLDDLPQIIASWYRSSSAIKSARNLLTSIIHSEGQYLQFKFLALMQTVEATHRSFDSKNYMPEEDYEIVRKILVAAIPGNVGANHRASLKSRIEYGNELSLRTRLNELFLRLPEKLRPHVCNDFKAFVGQAVDLRNRLTHPQTGDAAVEPNPTQMWETSRRIQLLLTIVFLNDLGISFDKIEKIAKDVGWRAFVED